MVYFSMILQYKVVFFKLHIKCIRMVAYQEGNESEWMNFKCVIFKNLLLSITKKFLNFINDS